MRAAGAALLALAITADGAAVAQSTTPRAGDDQWKRIDRAISDHCRRTLDACCKPVLAELHHHPPELFPGWWPDGNLGLYSYDTDVVLGATVRQVGQRWQVIRLDCFSLLFPNFD